MAWSLIDDTTTVDLTAEVDASSLSIAQRAYAETSRLSGRITDEAGTISIATEHEVRLMDGGVKAFAGYVRTRTRTDRGVSSQRVYEIECQDYTTALGDDVADSATANRPAGESDKARIAALGAAFGTRGVVYSGALVVQLVASMPAFDYTGLTLHECLTEICKISGGSFYVDYDKQLHYFSSEALSAPFNLSDAPNGTTTFGYEDFKLRDDTTQYVNAVFVVGTGISGWRYLGGSPPAAGTRRAMVLRDDSVIDTATLNAVGDAALATYGNPLQPSSLVTYRPGLKAGQTVQITHAGWGISAVSYRIASIEARPLDRDRIAYTVFFGSNPLSLGDLVRSTDQSVAEAYLAAQGAAGSAVAAVLDLSIGGGNLVPNSSFEDGSIWTVGANWVASFAASDAFSGSDEARWTPSASNSSLASPFITVDRLAAYWASAWLRVRARTAGGIRMYVEEYSAANALLATTYIGAQTAVTAGWVRVAQKFVNAAETGAIVWNASTAKVKIGFTGTGGSNTGTFSVDGVQLERGDLMTAYAPAPYEITAASIGTTQIADDAITTPKLAAAAVVAGKIAAGTITATELAAGSVTTSKLATGAITLYDEYSTSILTPQGFSGAWLDFIGAGLYNASFALGVNGTVPDGRTAALPYWTALTAGGTVISWSAANGAVVFTPPVSSTGGAPSITSDPVPVRSGAKFRFSALYQAASALAPYSISFFVQPYDDAGTPIGAGTTYNLSAQTSTALTRKTSGLYTVPDKARSVTVKMTVNLGTSPAPVVTVYDVAMTPGDATQSAPYEAACSSTLTLGTSDSLITGTSIVASGTGLDPNRDYIVIGTFDFDVSASGAGVCVGSLYVNGAAFGPQALHGPATTGRDSVSQTWYVPTASLGSGLSLFARKTAGGGTAVANVTHTKLLAIPIA